MKKVFMALVLSLALTGCTDASGIVSDIQNSIDGATANFKKDVAAANTKKEYHNGVTTLQDAMDDVKEKKKAELEPINKQISEKEAKIVKILMNKDLTTSQKKAKTTLIQKDINNLKAQKEQIEEKYRKIISDYRYN